MLRPASLSPALVAGLLTALAALVAALLTGPAAALTAPPAAALAAGPGTAEPEAAPGLAPAASGRAASAGAAPGTIRQVPASARAEEDPLEVRLSSLSPAVVPERGAIRVRGTVTNHTAEQWSTVNVHAFRSIEPLTDGVALADAAATDPAEPVGSRITTPGTFDTIESLPPGETVRFSLRVPREELGITGAPGAYWFGVHALGDSPSLPSDGVSDGRARTFLPLVEGGGGRQAPRVDASVVVPVRAPVRHLADGRVAHPRGWRRLLSSGGRLRELVDVATATGTSEVTWLVDPAVPATVAQLAAGNPPRSLAPDPEAVARAEEDQGGDGSGDEGSGGDGGQDGDEADPLTESPGAIPGSQPDEEQELTPREQQLAALATDWLDDFRTRLAGEAVLSLPYGDLDVEAAAEHGPDWYSAATARSSDVLADLEIEADPAIASRNGVLSPGAVEAADLDATVLLGETAFVAPPQAPESVVRLLGRDVVLTSSGSSVAGPGPQNPTGPLAVRQRLLSEAALRLTDGTRRPMVAVLPPSWRPGDANELFSGLAQPWLRLAPVSDIASGEAADVPDSELAYTEQDAAARLDAPGFAAGSDLRSAARTLDGVLLSPSTLPAQVTGEALTSLSYSDRGRQQQSVSSIRASTAHLNDLLGSVRVEVPRSVTLSSQSGSLGATVVNGLDQPVRVAIEARSDGSLELRDPEVLELAPESRTRVLLNVTAHRLGIHNVRLVVTDEDGNPLGASVELPIRAAQVSQVIWLIIAVGAAMLFGAIAVRLVRRVRGARFRTRAEAAEAEAAETADSASGASGRSGSGAAGDTADDSAGATS